MPLPKKLLCLNEISQTCGAVGGLQRAVWLDTFAVMLITPLAGDRLMPSIPSCPCQHRRQFCGIVFDQKPAVQ